MWFSDSLPSDSNRPWSSRAPGRNPILQTRPEDVPPPARFSKARVSDLTPETQYLSSRPRGLAKGAFSDASQGSYSVGRDPETQYRPSRKQVEIAGQSAEEIKPSRKKPTTGRDERNPILQDDPKFEPEMPRPRASQDWRPSPLTEFANQKKHLLPSEIGIAVKDYSKRNQSSVFSSDEQEGVTPQTSGRKAVAVRSDETSDILQYRYALPYRDTTISEKPSQVLIRPDDLRDAQANQGMAEVYKAKTHLSRVKF